MRSIVVVIKGPEAKAGLNPILSSINGTIVPSREASITTENNAVLTTKANLGPYVKNTKV